MLKRERRGSLSSALLNARETAPAGDGGASTSESPAAPVEAERASVIALVNESAEAAPDPAAPESVLFSKGAASASAFRPSYWSYDRQPGPAPGERSGVVMPFAANAPGPAAAPAAPPQAGRSSWRASVLNPVAVFGCLSLVVSTTLFFLSGSPRTGQDIPAQRILASSEAPATPAPAVVAVTVPAVANPEPVAEPAVMADADAAGTVPPTADGPDTAPELAVAEPAAPEPPAPEPAAPEVAAPEVAAPEVAAPEVAGLEPAAPAPPARAKAEPPPPSPAAIVPAPVRDIATLIARGNQMLATGDIAAARLFYERAAEQGSGAAATAVARTYDPLFLDQAHVRGVRGDAATAADWYRKASAAGDRPAEIRLKTLIVRFPSLER